MSRTSRKRKLILRGSGTKEELTQWIIAMMKSMPRANPLSLTWYELLGRGGIRDVLHAVGNKKMMGPPKD